MICAKTKMKKLPESCNKCTLSNLNGNYYSDLERFCSITKRACPMERSENNNLKYIRPKWCPLVEV